jgi:sphingolipid delta-4 desaturase
MTTKTEKKEFEKDKGGYTPVPNYSRVSYLQPHWTRRKEIAEVHPEVQKLYGPNSFSATWVVITVLMLIGLAWIVQAYEFSWLGIFAMSYCVGAFIMHAQWVLIHELTHDLVFGDSLWNTFFLLLCNVTHIIPSGISFRYFHRQHHAFLNETYKDPDVPSPIEDRIFGHSMLGKATWLSLFSIFQTVRLLRAPQPFEWPTFFNFVGNGIFTYFIVTSIGIKAIIFLVLSSFLSVGLLLHPLGARWIAEHWAVKPLQETYSYYGIINTVAFNIGYHNEHHDFVGIPYNRLPLLRKIAPEYYEPLYQHASYIKLLWTFITNPNFTLKSRVVRWPKGVQGKEQ